MWIEVPETEPEDLIRRFSEELRKVVSDGNRKRRKGDKPPWYLDTSHKAAIFSHLMKREKGELVDADSGAHPYVHLACRALMIACQETGNVPSENGNN